jgi:hypothetical protein
VLDVLLVRVRHDDQIIDVSEREVGAPAALQFRVHDTLELSRGVLKTERHALVS